MYECPVPTGRSSDVPTPTLRDAPCRSSALSGGPFLRRVWVLGPAEHGPLNVRTGRDSSKNRRLKILSGISAAAVGVCAAAAVVTASGSQSSNPALDAEIR